MMNEITNRFEQLIESRSWKIAKQELATLVYYPKERNRSR